MKKYTMAVIIAFVSALSTGQFATAKVSKQELQSISNPDKVKTSIGELKFFDGAPTDATVEKVYDRGVRARMARSTRISSRVTISTSSSNTWA
jgi:hypothetical protein